MRLLAGSRDQVLDTANTSSIAAEQRAADDAGKVNYVGCHQEKAQRDRHTAIGTTP
jgi:hypothetical protein